MSNKQHYKDLNRDPNPANVPPPEQVEEQSLKTDPKPDKGQTAVRPPRGGVKDAPARAVKDEFHDDAARNIDHPDGATEDVSKVDPANVLLRVTDTRSGTVHDEAARQKLRDSELPTPSETVSVEGHNVDVFAAPEVLHPVEVAPHKRDTLIKDALRASGDPELVAKADAPDTGTPVGGDWHTEVVKHEGKILAPKARKPNRRERPKKQDKTAPKTPSSPSTGKAAKKAPGKKTAAVPRTKKQKAQARKGRRQSIAGGR